MFVLGSQSPRRKWLMEKDISSSFIIDVSDIDEKASLIYKPTKAVRDIARRKGEDVASRHPNDIVIAADTVVIIDKKIIGKPIDKEDAFEMLSTLSNRTHKVITAYYIHQNGKTIINHVCSYVKFNKLTSELIQAYIATGSPMDKAGAYGMQDNDKFHIVKSIKGSIKNVIGFPTDEIKKDLKKLNIKF